MTQRGKKDNLSISGRIQPMDESGNRRIDCTVNKSITQLLPGTRVRSGVQHRAVSPERKGSTSISVSSELSLFAALLAGA